MAATLVGHPPADAAPNWSARQRRVDDLLGSTLDPGLGTATTAVLNTEQPLDDPGLDTVLHGLEQFVPPERDSPVEALTSIGDAVRAADRLPDVLLIIARQARRALDASSVSIARLDHDESEAVTLLNVGDVGEGKERFPAGELPPADKVTMRNPEQVEAVLKGPYDGGTHLYTIAYPP